MALLTLAVLSLCLFAGVRAQFPMSCQTNITERVGVCCPKPNGHIHACGYPSRGICEDLPETNINYYPRVPDHIDTDRRNWPHAYVQKGCRCYGNFYGPDCSECKFGWTGRGCNVREKLRERRNVLSLTAQEKRIFQDTILRAKYILSGLGAVLPPFNETEEIRMVELSIYDMYIWIHYRTSHRPIGQCWESPVSYNFAHGGPHFPLWHRRYMLWVEKKLRSVSEDHHFTLPYWDWVAASNCTVCTNNLVGANNLTHPTGGLETDAPFHDFDLICPRSEFSNTCGTCDPSTSKGKLIRNYPNNVLLRNYTYPSVNQVKTTLSRGDYELLNPEQDVPPGDGLPRDFSGALESVHNTVHNIQSGSMSGLLTSPTDPIFILHHTFIDKLLEVWFKTHDIKDQQYPYTSYPLGEGAEEPMVGFFGPVDRIIDYFDYAEEFGYKYDTYCLSYEDGVECKKLDDDKKTSTTLPTPRSTETTTTTTTKPTTRPPTTPTTTTSPDQEPEDRDLWKGLAISSFAISIILLIILGIAVIVSLRNKSKRQNPYQLDSTSHYKPASNGSNGIVNVAYDKQGDYKEKF